MTRFLCVYATSLVAVFAIAVSSNANAQTPIETHADRTLTFEGAGVLPRGAWRFWTGSSQLDPTVETSGTGTQSYYGGIEFGLTDRLQLGFSAIHFDDVVTFDAGLGDQQILTDTISLQAKYLAHENGPLELAVGASVEAHKLDGDLFGPRVERFNAIGSLSAPLSYNISEDLQIQALGSVSFFSNENNDLPYFGTIAALGAGLSWQATQRSNIYGSVNVPLSGDNTIDSDGTLGSQPVYLLGTRYNLSPKIALDAYVTNAFGVTPATRILAFFPDGDGPLIGATVSLTPGKRPVYRENYRGLSGEPLSLRQTRLQRGGFLLASANTLSEGNVGGKFWAGDGTFGGEVQLGVAYDGQANFSYERRANDGSLTAGVDVPGFDDQWHLGVKGRFLDQANGSPVSLAVELALGRDTSDGVTGTFYAEMPVTYEASPDLAVTVAPKIAAFGEREFYGLGIGANYAFTENLIGIGEITQTGNDDNATLWAVGVRQYLDGSSIAFEALATNAIGQKGLGTLVAQDDTRFSLGVLLQF